MMMMMMEKKKTLGRMKEWGRLMWMLGYYGRVIHLESKQSILMMMMKMMKMMMKMMMMIKDE